jgi:hypothetical protein
MRWQGRDCIIHGPGDKHIRAVVRVLNGVQVVVQDGTGKQRTFHKTKLTHINGLLSFGSRGVWTTDDRVRLELV